MEGKYTKSGTFIALIALVITIVQIFPKSQKNIDGEWKMVTEINNSSFNSYKGMTIEWKMFICENEDGIKGTAEKIKVNNIDLDTKNKTTLEFEGNIKEDKIVLNYTENGKLRKTSGIIIANLDGNKFSGSFSQTAANTNGKIYAEKIE